ncbi:MBOAT family O-acyltransferase [Laedolimicola intestinihominis]|uniref:MBOAT family protein n=1 Tax=Laedolimicola intestinihominis TaxID=3133166 RepID=A0ABV1FLP3_9FIRM
MVFSSIVFLFAFLPPVLAVYYLAPVKLRNLVLLVASLIFYAWGEPVYIGLMGYSILWNYVMGLDIARFKEKGKSGKWSLALGVAVNLLILGFFKYYGFLAENLEALLPVKLPELTPRLPIGLSFYTFQSISYLADVYRGKAKRQTNLISFGLYISMFPQLVAGPIVQYADVDAQFQKREMSPEKFGNGVRYFISGLSKKVLLANNLGVIFQEITALSGLSVLSAWLGVLAYTLQIYFDFSGYSDMAIGLGKMLGFEFRPNFNYPYCAKSITDFWRRWHMSLSSWFREYVYIPLGGNRVKAGRHMFNLLVVWMLTGLWHGASWNFVVWGLYYGILLIFEKYVLKGKIEQWPVLRRVYTLFLVMTGWVFFFSPSLTAAGQYLTALFGRGAAGLADAAGLYYLTTGLVLFILAALFSTPLPFGIWRKLQENDWWDGLILVGYLALFLLAVAYLIRDTYNPFLYFRF